jgi:hypothetical protein
MDTLGLLINKAAQDGLLQPLAPRALQHRVSLYADDVVLFLRPAAMDINVILDCLRLFGDVSGLRTNVQKSSVYPIRCGDQDLAMLQNMLPCELAEFPCRYLGLPLAIKKLSKIQVQPIIDKIANQLSGWKAELLTKAGRKVHVKHVLIGMVIYLAMVVDLSAWALKAIDKIRRGFLWRG